MMPSKLIRLGGLAALLGGVLLAIKAAFQLLKIAVPTPDDPSSELATTWSYTILNGISLLGFALLLVGLVALYAAQSEVAGVLGLAGFLALFFGAALSFGREWFEVFVLPDAAAAAPEWVDAKNTGWIFLGFSLPGLFAGLGWWMFAVASLRARIYPRAAIVALMVGLTITSLSLPGPLGVGSIIRNAAVVWLGFALFTGRVGSKEEPLMSLNLVRWGALAAVLGGVSWIAWGPIRAFGTPSFYANAALNIALLGTLGGLIGLHALQERRYGRVGLAGFYSAFVGTVLVLVVRVNGTGDDVLEPALAVGGLGVIVGFVLLGIAILRARVLPRWCGLLLIASLPLWVASVVVFGLVAANGTQLSTGTAPGLICLALGYVLWRACKAVATHRGLWEDAEVACS